MVKDPNKYLESISRVLDKGEMGMDEVRHLRVDELHLSPEELMKRARERLGASISKPKTDYSTTWMPRGNKVLLRSVKVDFMRGLAVPEASASGKKFVVVALGPDVTNLEVGEECMPIGQQKVDWDYLPGSNDLLVVNEGNIIIHRPSQQVEKKDLTAIPTTDTDYDEEYHEG